MILAKPQGKSSSKPRRSRASKSSRRAQHSSSQAEATNAGTSLTDSVTQLWEDMLSSLKEKLKQIRSKVQTAPSVVGSSGKTAAASTPGAAAAAAAAAAQVVSGLVEEVQAVADKIFAMSEDAVGTRGKGGTGGPPADRDRVHKVRLKIVEILKPLMMGDGAVVLLRVSRTLLRVCVNAFRLERLRPFEGTLLSTVKVLYKLGKDSDHDALFLSEGVLSSLIELLSISVANANGNGLDGVKSRPSSGMPNSTWQFDQEVMLFASSTLKFLSGHTKNQSWLATQGRAIPILAPIFSVRASPAGAAARAKPNGKTRRVLPVTDGDVAQVLVQVSEVLRNLSRMKYAKQFYENKVISRLCDLIPVYKSHEKLMYNVSRVLGKFSLDSKCRAIINTKRSANCRHFLELCELHPEHNGMLVRLCFTLGNLTASNNDNRRLIAMQLGGMLKLSRLLHTKVTMFVSKVEIQRQREEALEADTTGADEDELQELSDVLVKLIRVLANLAIHEEVGPLILAETVARDVALVVEHCAAGRDEELLLNAVSTLTNLSFYENWAANSSRKVLHRGFIFQSRLDLLNLLLPLATHENDEVVAHALRVIGNLSRDAEVRERTVTLKGVDLLTLLLDKSDPEIVVTACGILVNFAADSDFVGIFSDDNEALTRKLAHVVDEAVEADEAVCDQIATNALKCLVNLLGHGVAFPEDAHRLLFECLDPYFGDQNSPDDGEDGELVDIARACLSALGPVKAPESVMEPL